MLIMLLVFPDYVEGIWRTKQQNFDLKNAHDYLLRILEFGKFIVKYFLYLLLIPLTYFIAI